MLGISSIVLLFIGVAMLRFTISLTFSVDYYFLCTGMWHSLTHGEPEENKEIVFKQAADWILERS